MVTEEQAIIRAQKYLDELSKVSKLDLIIVGAPEKLPRGYLFKFNSRKWIEEHDISSMMVGNLPFLVNMLTGEIDEDSP